MLLGGGWEGVVGAGSLYNHLLRKRLQSYLTRCCSASVQGSNATIEMKVKPAIVCFFKKIIPDGQLT